MLALLAVKIGPPSEPKKIIIKNIEFINFCEVKERLNDVQNSG